MGDWYIMNIHCLLIYDKILFCSHNFKSYILLTYRKVKIIMTNFTWTFDTDHTYLVRVHFFMIFLHVTHLIHNTNNYNYLERLFAETMFSICRVIQQLCIGFLLCLVCLPLRLQAMFLITWSLKGNVIRKIPHPNKNIYILPIH